MKRIIIIIIIALINTAILNAQTKATIKWGKEYNDKKTSTLGYIAGHDDKGFYTVRTKIQGLSYKYYLENFDNNLNIGASKKQKLKVGKKKVKFEGLIVIGKKLFLVTYRIDRKTKTKRLFVQKVDKKTMEPSSKFTEIAKFSIKESGLFNKGAFNYILSEDESKILVYYDLPFKKNQPEKFGLKVFDTNFKKIWSKDVVMKFSDWEFRIEDYELSNKGDVYVTGLKYDEKPKFVVVAKRKSKPKYHYEILGFTNNGKDEKIYSVDLEDYFITDMKVDINDNNDIVCGGYYSKKTNAGAKVALVGHVVNPFSIGGSYFITIDSETEEIESKTFKDFDIDFITQNLKIGQAKRKKKKQAKGKNVQLFNYSLDDIIFNKDGSAFLVAEQYYVHTYTTVQVNSNGTRTTITHYVYHYNDIIVTKMNADGEIEWNTKIAKKQTSTDDGGFYSSYAIQKRDNDIIFIFNDNEKNLNYSGSGGVYDSFTFKKKDAIAVMVTLNKNGEYKKTTLFKARSKKEGKSFVVPKVCMQKNDDEMIVYAQRFPFMGPSKNKFGIINFK